MAEIQGIPILDDPTLSEDDIIRMHGDFFQDFSDVYAIDKGEELVNCTSGVLGSLQLELFRLVILTIQQRLVLLTCLPDFVKHLLIILGGIYAFCDFVKEDHFFNLILFFIIIAVSFILAAPFPRKGYIVTVASSSLILFLEFWYGSNQTASLRGILMSLVMRLSSFAFDYERRIITNDRGTLSFFSYLFNPASIIFGPFCTFKEYIQTFQRRTYKEELIYLIKSILCIGVCLISVLISSCSLLVEPNDFLQEDYLTALSFRTSHYFICFFAQGLFWLSGGKGWTVDALAVELPRSVVEIVVAWNIPMHKYLKNYIYKPIAKIGNFGLAVASTFIISSLLHGFNVKLSAVLLSLGYITYVETGLRYQISTLISGCTLARKCKQDCGHSRKSTNLLTFVVNGTFTLLAVYHLIYLGMIFDGQEPGHDNLTQMLKIWGKHNYLSHLMAVTCHFCSIILSIFMKYI